MIFINGDAILQILDKESNKGQEIFEKLEKSKEIFAITSITFYEVRSLLINKGIYILAAPINLLQVYEFTKEDAQKAIEMELELKKKGKDIYSSDLQISAIVINNGGTLCTMDNRLKVLEELGLKLFLV
jgi:predicted nucleic acid-binding protein